MEKQKLSIDPNDAALSERIRRFNDAEYYSLKDKRCCAELLALQLIQEGYHVEQCVLTKEKKK